MSETKEVIAAMLKENTGRHFLDSGGAYGRHWEHNQLRDFESEPESSLSVRWGYLDVTHNLYHWLIEKLDFDEPMQRLFDAYVKWYDNRNYEQGWLFYQQEFPDWLMKKFGVECSGLYGDSSGPMTVNTYNGEDLLSQTIQYTYFGLEDDIEAGNLYVPGGVYVILSIHGGCDVRGGYTAPKCFTPTDMDGTGVFYNADAHIGVENADIYWYSDDGYHYYEEGAAGYMAGKQLETYEIVEPDALVELTIITQGLEKQTSRRARFAWRLAERLKRCGCIDDYKMEPYILNDDGVAIWPPTMGQMYSSF